MDNSSFIQLLHRHIAGGHANAYTEPLMALVHKAIAENTASPEQQAQLAALAKKLAALPRGNLTY